VGEKKLMLGNEAIARGLWEAGVKVASAYPGTPSTEVQQPLGSLSNEPSAETPDKQEDLPDSKSIESASETPAAEKAPAEQPEEDPFAAEFKKRAYKAPDDTE